MRISGPKAAVAFATVGPGLLASCVYFNTLYNAEALYREAEDLRLSGKNSAGAERYREVVTKATNAYQADEEGGWADDALLLVAKAHLRLGEVPEASRALGRVLEISDDSDVRGQAALYRGAVAVAAGETVQGLALLDEALADIDDPIHRAEGHLWRARAQLALGMVEQGWRELDQAVETHSSHVVPVGFERVAWGFTLPDLTRIHQGIQNLIFASRAESYGDSIRTLVQRFADRWGAGSAVVLLGNAENAHWSRDERDRLLMTRARLAHEAGFMARANEDARSVGSGVGERAFEARVMLARWELAEAEHVDDLAPLRAVLLPAVMSGEAQALLNAIRRVELLTEYGLDGEPVALFGAAEICRDVLGARRLSGALFQLYADSGPEAPWSAKALLAAREMTTDAALREGIDRRLDALPGDAYVRYARRGLPMAELGELESRLQAMLDSLIERVDEELTARRQLAGVPKK